VASLIASINAGGDSSTVTSGAVDTTGADLIVAWAIGYLSVVSFTDSKGNTYTPLTLRADPGGINGKFWYCFGPIVGSGHTFSSGSSFPVIGVLAFNCGFGSDPFDVENGANGTGTSIQPGSVTPSNADNIVITGVGEGTTGGTPSVDGGFTEPNAEADGAAFSATIAYLIQSAATAQNPTWSGITSGGFGNVAGIAVFNAAAAGGGGNRRRRVIMCGGR
jgi:hypothetical protein